jgi:hypothetical protein
MLPRDDTVEYQRNLDAVSGLQLFQDMRDVRFDAGLAYLKQICDFLIKQALRNKTLNFLFPGGKAAGCRFAISHGISSFRT